MPTSRKGFTLVELLVVISIIALLVSILMPSLSRAKELAYRMKCGSNLAASGKALILYTRTYNSFYPMLDTTHYEMGAIMYFNGNWGRPGDTAVYTGLNRQEVPDGQKLYCITALPWMLVREGNNPKIFLCPSDTEARPQPEGDVKYQTPEGNMGYCYDFSSDANVSYSYQSARHGVTWPSQLIIMADKTPVYSLGDRAYQEGWSSGMTREQTALNMSQNHTRGEAINVLFAEGRVATNQPRADINMLTNPADCIYTWYNGKQNAASSINVDPNAQVGVQNSLEGIVEDSFLHGPYRQS